MSSNNSVFCPYCGSPQEKGQKFCSSCGASLDTSKSSSEDTGVKIIRETSLHEVTSQSPVIQQDYTYGSAPSQSYVGTTVEAPKDNATIALILGVIGFVFSCFLFPIIGLSFVRKAEENNEDQQLITIAKILNWIQLGLQIVGLLFGLGYLIWFLLMWY